MKKEKKKKVKMKKVKKDYIPTWDEYFMQIALTAAERAHCIWANIGAAIARVRKEKKPIILSTGYNGPVRDAPHCDKVGCKCRYDNGKKKEGKNCIGSHAEMNAITNAADAGISIANSTLFVTLSPCLECAKHIVNSIGIKKVVYLEKYSKVFGEKEKEANAAIKFFKKRNKACKRFKGRLVVRDSRGSYELKHF
ncbi:MAG: dCMP deaminase family protein [Patescibacteria group bacterium]